MIGFILIAITKCELTQEREVVKVLTEKNASKMESSKFLNAMFVTKSIHNISIGYEDKSKGLSTNKI